jgi:hypothetical protein
MNIKSRFLNISFTATKVMKNNELQKFEEKKFPSGGRVVGRSNRLTPTAEREGVRNVF